MSHFMCYWSAAGGRTAEKGEPEDGGRGWARGRRRQGAQVWGVLVRQGTNLVGVLEKIILVLYTIIIRITSFLLTLPHGRWTDWEIGPRSRSPFYLSSQRPLLTQAVYQRTPPLRRSPATKKEDEIRLWFLTVDTFPD